MIRRSSASTPRASTTSIGIRTTPDVRLRLALRRPGRRARLNRLLKRCARRDLQPRRPVPREGVVRRARVHRRVTGLGAVRLLEAMRELELDAAFLPGVVVRDVRQGRRDAADGDDAVLPAQPLRRGQGLRLLHHAELPRGVRDVRGERHPVQPRVAAPRRDVRHPQDHARGGPDQAGHCRDSCTSATSTRGATGASPATTSRRCG